MMYDYIIFLPLLNHCGTIQIGEPVNLFRDFGLLSNVIPHFGSDRNNNYYEQYFPRIFDPSSLIGNKTKCSENELNIVDKGKWSVDVVDTTEEILGNLFSKYKFDFVESVWKTMVLNFSGKQISLLLGMRNIGYRTLPKDIGYLILKYEERANIVKICDVSNLIIDENFGKEISNFELSEIDTNRFLSTQASHFVSSYVEGEIIFQIFVINATTTQRWKNMKKNLTDSEFINFAKQNAVNDSIRFGKIGALGRNLTELNVFNTRLKSSEEKVASLFYLLENESNFKIEDYFSDRPRVIQFNLTSVCDIISNETKASWAREIISNQMLLRELFLIPEKYDVNVSRKLLSSNFLNYE